jgi:RnfABCDGE-type electron transport complex B subunit
MNNIIVAILVLGIMGGVFGLILAIASKVFAVKIDPRLAAIAEHLAGANCGGCGYAGCSDCASHILEGSAPVNACAPAGAANAAAIAQIMGVKIDSAERKVAFVKCNGGVNAAKRFEYKGVHDCISATKVAAGPLDCEFGCLGFGSCISACKFDAIHIGPNGAALVTPEKCTDCGVCAAACPRHLIDFIPDSSRVHVACSNTNTGKAAMSVCSNSCIGCGLCAKTCRFDAIHVVNGVAVIDYAKCKGCKSCTKVCPRNAIFPIPTPEEKNQFKAAQKAQAEKAAQAVKAPGSGKDA